MGKRDLHSFSFALGSPAQQANSSVDSKQSFLSSGLCLLSRCVSILSWLGRLVQLAHLDVPFCASRSRWYIDLAVADPSSVNGHISMSGLSSVGIGSWSMQDASVGLAVNLTFCSFQVMSGLISSTTAVARCWSPPCVPSILHPRFV